MSEFDNIDNTEDNIGEVNDGADLSGSEETTSNFADIIKAKDDIIAAKDEIITTYETQVASLKGQISRLVHDGAVITDGSNPPEPKEQKHVFGGFGKGIENYDGEIGLQSLGLEIGKRD